ncbi:hypothetical protein A7X86_14340 [Stenotrophomonas maltophilia]|nr:hypothetical protein A9K70_08455 [Stenotrophomonas maltophilia]PZT16552.1 hypothetical protein A7X86_14340 [Stenotrophomonas maltophilia]PZT47023.1 hypothetical protein A7X99_14720 [Stenotrophomonas maltophilia]
MPPQQQAGCNRARQAQDQQRDRALLQHGQQRLRVRVAAQLFGAQAGGQRQAPADQGRNEHAHRNRVPGIHGFTCLSGDARSIRARPLTG